MSIHASVWGWEQEVRNTTQRVVLLALCDNAAGPDAEVPGLCWPSVATLSKRCCVKERQVRRTIDDLAEMGLIVKHRRRRRADGTLSVWEYIVPFLSTGQECPLDSSTTGHLAPSPPVISRHNHRSPVTAQEPSYEPSVEPSLSNTLSETDASVEVVRSGVSFDEWYEAYPKKQGKATARTKFNRLSNAERTAAMEATLLWAEYARQHPQGNQFVPMASTFLNQRRWEDELPTLPQAPQSTAQARREHNQGVLERARQRSTPAMNRALEAWNTEPKEIEQ